jgi:hypothetical protein
MSETLKGQREQGIDAMLTAINKPDESFTTGRYNILRVVAAFPLDVNFNSGSTEVGNVLREDKHALALLPRSALTSALATYPYGPDIIWMLTKTLKRTRGEVDDEAEVGQPNPKSRKITPGSTDLNGVD